MTPDKIIDAIDARPKEKLNVLVLPGQRIIWDVAVAFARRTVASGKTIAAVVYESDAYAFVSEFSREEMSHILVLFAGENKPLEDGVSAVVFVGDFALSSGTSEWIESNHTAFETLLLITCARNDPRR